MKRPFFKIIKFSRNNDTSLFRENPIVPEIFTELRDYLHESTSVQFLECHQQIQHHIRTFWGLMLIVLFATKVKSKITEETCKWIVISIIHHTVLLQALLAAFVVSLSFLLIGEDFVSSCEIMEFLGSIWIVWILVGMPFLCKPPVRFFHCMCRAFVAG